MIPQIDDVDLTNEEEIKIPSKTYKLNINETEDDTIAGFVDDVDAIKQSIYHILSIERYAYDIYDDDYGVELEQYIGQDFEYLQSTIQDTLEEALTQDERILAVEVTKIEKIQNDAVLVAFNAITQNNEIEMEVTINV